MQSIKQLAHILETLADEEHYLFSLSDLSAAIPVQTPTAFKALIGRAEKTGLLKRICRGLYLYPKVKFPKGLILYRAAGRLRADEFNYISLETVLSDAGVISQIPTNWITLMSSGRTYIYNCGEIGNIEFIHTKKSIEKILPDLHYDKKYHLWCASVALAYSDMKLARRNIDLINKKALDELI